IFPMSWALVKDKEISNCYYRCRRMRRAHNLFSKVENRATEPANTRLQSNCPWRGQCLSCQLLHDHNVIPRTPKAPIAIPVKVVNVSPCPSFLPISPPATAPARVMIFEGRSLCLVERSFDFVP